MTVEAVVALVGTSGDSEHMFRPSTQLDKRIRNAAQVLRTKHFQALPQRINTQPVDLYAFVATAFTLVTFRKPTGWKSTVGFVTDRGGFVVAYLFHS